MAFGKRATLGTGFGVLIGLLVLSIALAYHIQEGFSQRSVAIHREYVNDLEVVTHLRRLLYEVGTNARDYLLNPAPGKAVAYRAHMQDIRRTGEPLLARLRESTAKRAAVEELEKHIRELWKVTESLADPNDELVYDYAFVQRQIAPPRSAAGKILQELESANRSALNQSEEEFSATRAAAASSLLWLLAACLLGGVAITWFSLRYSNHLERQAKARFEEVLAAKLELERLSNRLMEIQEEERTRLSRELHDEIVQNVAVLKIEITQALAGLHHEPAVEPLTRARELADRTVRAVRNISLLLRPSLLDDLGLGPALQWVTDDFNKRTSVPCTYIEDNLQESLPDTINTCVYRVVQEALRNCEKHSNAGHVRVQVVQTSGEINVEVRDDGIGFMNAARSPMSLGVLGMRERAAALGGELSIETSAGKGTLVRLSLPYPKDTEQRKLWEAHA